MTSGAAILVAPCRDERVMGKASNGPAREVVFDLEDAIAPQDKAAARARLANFFVQGPPAAAVSVRINAPDTPWFEEDLAVVARLPIASVVVPKAEAPDVMSAVAARTGRPVVALLETPAGVAAAGQIASAPQVEGLLIGYADLAVALGRRGEVPLERWWFVQEQVLLAARVAGVRAIDGPWLRIDVDDDFVAAASQARVAGFDAKWVLHPSQIATVEGLFAPSRAEYDHARAVVAAAQQAAEAGLGVVQLDGQMIDAPVLAEARRVLEWQGEVRG